MSFNRKYDIGHGVIVTDDGHTIRAEWKHADGKSSTSIGVERPIPAPAEGESVEVRYSLNRKHYYLPKYCGFNRGIWMSVATYPSVEEIKAQNLSGLGAPGYIQITKKGGESYYRDVLDFMTWSVKADPNVGIEPVDEKIKDYLSWAHARQTADEQQFDESLAWSGRTLKWIMEKIGPWVPAPPEPAPTVLSD